MSFFPDRGRQKKVPTTEIAKPSLDKGFQHLCFGAGRQFDFNVSSRPEVSSTSTSSRSRCLQSGPDWSTCHSRPEVQFDFNLKSKLVSSRPDWSTCQDLVRVKRSRRPTFQGQRVPLRQDLVRDQLSFRSFKDFSVIISLTSKVEI